MQQEAAAPLQGGGVRRLSSCSRSSQDDEGLGLCIRCGESSAVGISDILQTPCCTVYAWLFTESRKVGTKRPQPEVISMAKQG